jgi:SMC interacting uncharacterized protein involved in chromosome segregation
MKKIIILILSFIALSAQPATKEDIKELKQDIRLLINKVNEIDKKVYANSIKIDMLEKNMNKRFEQVDKRFEQIDKRFEQVDKRFEQVDKRFEDMNKRFEDMLNYLWMISAAFLGLTAVTIGFAIWDRKSTIKAVKDEIVEDIKTNKLKEFIYELKKLAKEDMELAKVLRSFHML